jgi:hypothetical protein
MAFGQVVRQLVVMNKANFGSLIDCHGQLRGAGEAHRRTYSVLKVSLATTGAVTAPYGWGFDGTLASALGVLAGLEEVDQDGETALVRAVKQRRYDHVADLLHAGLDANASTAEGHTCLILAAQAGCKSLVDLLVTVGKADLHSKTVSLMRTALHGAASCGHVGTSQYLVMAKADIDARDGNGATPLVLAARVGHDNVVRYLLSARAEINPTLRFGKTLLSEVTRLRKFTTAQILQEALAKV